VAPSLIADLFPASRRGNAMGLYNLVMPLGAAVGFGVGGAVGAHFGWRAAFLVAGLPGLALAFAYLLLPEPQRGATDGDAPVSPALSPRATLQQLLRNRDFVLNTAGQILLTFTVGGLANWMPSFLVRTLGMTPGAAGTSFGVLTASAGVLGTIAGHRSGEWARKRTARGYFWVAGVSLLVAAPCVLLMASAPGTVGTLVATFLALFFVLFNSAPLFTALVNGVPASLRASAVAFNLLAIHVLGDALSPPLVGMVSDATGSLAIAVAACALPLVGGGLLLLGAARAPQPGPTAAVDVNCA
jgi:predicted MFS family arabinose efflux permease